MRTLEDYKRISLAVRYEPGTGAFFWETKTPGCVKRAGCVAADGYVRIKFENKLFSAHRVAWFLTHGELPEQIDHINMDKADNRLCNLRAATRMQNTQNRPARSDNTTGFKGVMVYRANGKYMARIKVNGERKHLGYFDTPEEASAAYIKAAGEFHGEFARH